MKSKVISIGKTIFTLALLLSLVSFIDLHELWMIWASVNIWYFFIMIGLWYLAIYISSLRWEVILGFYNIHVSTGKLFSLYWVGAFFNNFLPSSFGGDSYKFIYLNREYKGNKSKILSSILLERIIGLVSGIPLSLCVGIILSRTIEFSQELWGLLAFSSVLFLLVLVSLFLPFRFPDTQIKFAKKIVTGFNTLLSFNSPLRLIKSLIYSILFFIVNIFSLFLLFQAFGETLSPFWIIFIYPIVQLSGAIPFSINALGIQEGIAIYLFSLFNVPSELTLSVMITSRLLTLVVSSTGGLRYLMIK